MENKLEQLLNSLIEKGWKPFGKGWLNLRRLSGIHKWWLLLHEPSTRVADNYSLRDIVSKSSGLWQFVCENNLAPIVATEEWIKHYYKDIDDDNLISWENIQPTTEYEYRLIETSLKNEDELEQFLLDNIIINEQA